MHNRFASPRGMGHQRRSEPLLVSQRSTPLFIIHIRKEAAVLDISCQYGGFLYAVGVLRRQSFQYLQKYQMKVILDLYDQIYLSEFAPSLSPFRLRRQLEKELPADSAGETLSINNVLAITRYGITSAYYVDPDKLVLQDSSNY